MMIIRKRKKIVKVIAIVKAILMRILVKKMKIKKMKKRRIYISLPSRWILCLVSCLY